MEDVKDKDPFHKWYPTIKTFTICSFHLSVFSLFHVRTEMTMR